MKFSRILIKGFLNSSLCAELLVVRMSDGGGLGNVEGTIDIICILIFVIFIAVLKFSEFRFQNTTTADHFKLNVITSSSRFSLLL